MDYGESTVKGGGDADEIRPIHNDEEEERKEGEAGREQFKCLGQI